MNAKHTTAVIVAKRLFWAILAGLTLSLATQEAKAQIPQYPLNRPTLPRELNYFRRDVGLLDQYNTFVAPQQMLEARLRQMNQQQLDDYRSTQRQLDQVRQIRGTSAGPTGVGAGYFNYSHYYRMPGGGRSR